MFIAIRNLQERRSERDSQFEGTRDIRSGYLFEVNGSVAGDREGLVWFKAIDGNSEPFQVFYNGIIGDLRANMFVKIERNPKQPARWQITEFDTGLYFDDQSTFEQLPSTSMIPAKEDYEWPPGYPGAKALNIFPRAVTSFAVRPTDPASMKVRVYSGIYPGVTYFERFAGPVNTKDFTADIPGAGLARKVAISVDNTGTLKYTNGTTFVAGLPMPDASLPQVPSEEVLISSVRLVNGMSAIEESNFDLEMRPLMANGTVNVKVSEVWESDFGAVALQADATGKIEVGKTTGPDAKFEVLDTAGAQLRLTFEDAVKFADLTVDTNHDLTINTSSTGIVKIDSALQLNIGTQAYNLQGRTGSGAFIFAGQGSNTPAFFEMFTGDGDGTDDVGIRIFSKGLPTGLANRERLEIIIRNTGIIDIKSEAQGTGTLRPIQIFTEGNDNQIRLAIDGNVGFGVASPSTRLDIGAGAMEFDEMTAPGGGAVNTARLYAVDNGAEKTQLVVIFNTGAVQVLATQPEG